ncbi:MAG TPA: SpoIIE family protein phosphatase [Thermoanaerobaculia bacterium]|nr:SpoIIE family protein phosphatase [Thermoanaerobaculia bacterium]
MQTYGWRNRSDVVREVLIGIGVGVAISLIESGGTREFPPAHTFIRNSFLGVLIMLFTRGGETLFSPRIARSTYPSTFRTLIYMVGGWLGYIAGLGGIFLATSGLDRDEFRLSYHFIYSLFACAFLSICIGFITHYNRQRNDRMKAIEFAEKELEIARQMQQRLLPPPLIEHDGFRVIARTQPARIVGGDFYDVVRLGDGAHGVIIADVSGKGIAASLLMASCKAMIPLLAATGSVADVMHALNANLCEQLGKREFVAMLFARFDSATGELELVNAGMPDPYIIGSGAPREILFTGDRFPLGVRRDMRYEPSRAALAPGERLLLISDGFPEAMAGEEPVGYDRMELMLHQFDTVDELISSLAAIPNIRIDDDLTVVTLERRG